PRGKKLALMSLIMSAINLSLSTIPTADLGKIKLGFGCVLGLAGSLRVFHKLISDAVIGLFGFTIRPTLAILTPMFFMSLRVATCWAGTFWSIQPALKGLSNKSFTPGSASSTVGNRPIKKMNGAVFFFAALFSFKAVATAVAAGRPPAATMRSTS